MRGREQTDDVGHGRATSIVHGRTWHRRSAMWSGRRGGSRRVTRRTPASTDGTGRKESAGRRRPRLKDHQGAHAVESTCVGGVAARLRATSHCTTRSARRRPLARSSSRWRSRCRGGAEGQRADRPEGAARHAVAERASQHTTVMVVRPRRRTSRRRRVRPVRIAFERDDVHAAPGQRERAGAAARTDLDDEVAGREGRVGDQRGRRASGRRKFCPRRRRRSSRGVRLPADTEDDRGSP